METTERVKGIEDIECVLTPTASATKCGCRSDESHRLSTVLHATVLRVDSTGRVDAPLGGSQMAVRPSGEMGGDDWSV